MREILFRGKRVDNGEWIDGSFCPKNSKGDMTELKPCPFCGGEAVVFIKDWDNRADEYKIVCSKCGIQQEEYTFQKEKAIEAWNRRANDA